MNELALFAGVGGGILGGHLLGWRTICAVEWNKYSASVLIARQNDGILPAFPIWDDVQTFDGRPWQGIVDVISGGFPCQDISAAGKGAGIEGERSGMWREMARIICEVRPKYVFVENSPMLTSRGLGTVLGDLASMGFNAEWGVLGAADVGAPHQRDRIWIVAYANGINGGRTRYGQKEKNFRGKRVNQFGGGGETMANANCEWEQQPSESKQNGGVGTEFCGKKLADTNNEGLQGTKREGPTIEEGQSNGYFTQCDWWKSEPDVGRVANGVAARMDRLKALGNGQVSQVARIAWQELNGL